MKFGVVIFPGSNCDRDTIHVLSRVLNQEVIILWHKERDISSFETSDTIILPGGFSYGDYLRSGALARFSPIMESIAEFSKKGGKVIGICNGFQILCEAQLLPGVLMHNQTQSYICKNIYIRPQTKESMITRTLNQEKAYKIPIAHGEGRYYCDEQTLKQLIQNDQILFRYCDEDGQYTSAANPNGSLDNIAGICNAERNVYGMMPHPERAAEPGLGNTDGLSLLVSLIGKTAKGS